MDQRRIGTFLKQLRKEKGITQEQLAEELFVSGRTVSRWETGTNLPDLGMLIQICEYYDVEVKEILNGERESGKMDNALKETLLEVADYQDFKKKKQAAAGNLAFGITFMVCAASIVVQMFLSDKPVMVAGETLILVVGGISYLLLIVKNGVWESAEQAKHTNRNHFLVSLVCAGIFSAFLFFLLQGKAEGVKVLQFTLLFFVVILAVGYGVLSLLSFLSNHSN